MELPRSGMVEWHRPGSVPALDSGGRRVGLHSGKPESPIEVRNGRARACGVPRGWLRERLRENRRRKDEEQQRCHGEGAQSRTTSMLSDQCVQGGHVKTSTAPVPIVWRLTGIILRPGGSGEEIPLLRETHHAGRRTPKSWAPAAVLVSCTGALTPRARGPKKSSPL